MRAQPSAARSHHVASVQLYHSATLTCLLRPVFAIDPVCGHTAHSLHDITSAPTCTATGAPSRGAAAKIPDIDLSVDFHQELLSSEAHRAAGAS